MRQKPADQEEQLSNIESLLFDQKRHVTFMALSQSLAIPALAARQLLEQFIARHSDQAFQVLYLLTGVLKTANEQEEPRVHTLKLVPKDKLEEELQRFHTVHSKHVFSVSPCAPNSSAELLPSWNKTSTFDPSLSTIKCTDVQLRTNLTKAASSRQPKQPTKLTSDAPSKATADKPRDAGADTKTPEKSAQSVGVTSSPSDKTVVSFRGLSPDTSLTVPKLDVTPPKPQKPLARQTKSAKKGTTANRAGGALDTLIKKMTHKSVEKDDAELLRSPEYHTSIVPNAISPPKDKSPSSTETKKSAATRVDKPKSAEEIKQIYTSLVEEEEDEGPRPMDLSSEYEEQQVPTEKGTKKSDKSRAVKKRKRVIDEDDIEEDEDEKESPQKQADSKKKRTHPNESEDDGSVEAIKENPAAKTKEKQKRASKKAKRSAKTPSPKQQKKQPKPAVVSSDEEEVSDEDFEPAARVMEIEEDQVDETMQSSPPKHGQQNLMGMMSATASGPQPQKRIKTIERVDEKGYTVFEDVEVYGSDDEPVANLPTKEASPQPQPVEKKEPAAAAKAKPTTKATKTQDSKKKAASAVQPSTAKKSATSSKKSKTSSGQSNILSFFKKTG